MVYSEYENKGARTPVMPQAVVRSAFADRAEYLREAMPFLAAARLSEKQATRWYHVNLPNEICWLEIKHFACVPLVAKLVARVEELRSRSSSSKNVDFVFRFDAKIHPDFFGGWQRLRRLAIAQWIDRDLRIDIIQQLSGIAPLGTAAVQVQESDINAARKVINELADDLLADRRHPPCRRTN